MLHASVCVYELVYVPHTAVSPQGMLVGVGRCTHLCVHDYCVFVSMLVCVPPCFCLHILVCLVAVICVCMITASQLACLCVSLPLMLTRCACALYVGAYPVVCVLASYH